MTSRTADFAHLVRQQGFRYTPQRQLILDAIREGAGHTTPEEIYKRVRAKSPAVNRATVYRNVEFLCEVRVVVAAQIGGQMYYELAGVEPHHHLICRKCNAIEQMSHATVKDFFSKVEREQSFLVDMDHLTLFGICKACQRLEQKTKRNT
jgi:Fur family transcriptional regulator, ferric uptake regulator